MIKQTTENRESKHDTIDIIITMDYETFDTDDFILNPRYQIDWEKDLIEPTEKFATLLEKQGAYLTVLWDTVEYFWLEDHGELETARKIREQLQNLVKRGHDVQLHLHPAWATVRKESGHWIWEKPGITAPKMNPTDFDTLVRRSVETMQRLFSPIRSNYAVRGFRGRSYEVEPFEHIAGTLLKYGIYADSSYHGEKAPLTIKIPHLNKEVSTGEANFLEYPILKIENKRWDFSGHPGETQTPLEIPFTPDLLNRTWVMIGHCKQPIHYDGVDQCLSLLKQKYGKQITFLRWQESIDNHITGIEKNIPPQIYATEPIKITPQSELEKILESIYWKGKHVLCYSRQCHEIQERWAPRCKEWQSILIDDLTNEIIKLKKIDILILDEVNIDLINKLKPGGTLVMLNYLTGKNRINEPVNGFIWIKRYSLGAKVALGRYSYYAGKEQNFETQDILLLNTLKKKIKNKRVVLAPVGQSSFKFQEFIKTHATFWGYYDRNTFIKTSNGNPVYHMDNLKESGAEIVIITSLSFAETIRKDLEHAFPYGEIIAMNQFESAQKAQREKIPIQPISNA